MIQLNRDIFSRILAEIGTTSGCIALFRNNALLQLNYGIASSNNKNKYGPHVYYHNADIDLTKYLSRHCFNDRAPYRASFPQRLDIIPTGFGVTKAPILNFSVSQIFGPAKVIIIIIIIIIMIIIIIIIIIIAYLYSANFICVSRHNAQKRFIVFIMD